MYADARTASMRHTLEETNRRREKQLAYNSEHGINPTPLCKRTADILDTIAREDADTQQLMGDAGRQRTRGKQPMPGLSSKVAGDAGRHAQELAACQRRTSPTSSNS
jgi:excinuclease ABC subunit B